VSGSISRTFVHTFTEAEKDEYLAALNNKGIGAAARELKIIELAARGSVNEARQLLAGIPQAGAKDPAEGDAVSEEITTGIEGGLGASATGKGGGTGVGASVSFSASRSLKRTVEKRDGKLIVTVQVVSEKGGTVGASGSYGLVGGGATYGGTSSVGRAVSFRLDPDDQARYDAVMGVDSGEQLDALAGRDQTSVVSDTHSKGTSASHSVSATLAGGEVSIGGTSAYSESVTVGESGTSKQFSGSHGGGASAGIAGGPKLGYQETQTVTSKVGPDKRATGDVSAEVKQSDLAGSVKALQQKFSDKPIGTAVGVATGGTALIHQTTEVIGMKLAPQDFDTIAAVAERKGDWDKAFHGHYNQSLQNWGRLAAKIRAANGDHEAIAKLLAEYAHDNDYAADAVQAVVRPPKQGEGGIRYDWPAELANERATFDSLVVADPLPAARNLAATGEIEGAIAQLNTLNTRLTGVDAAIEKNRAKFSDDAAVAEMHRRIFNRQKAVSAEISKLKAALAPPEATDTGPDVGPPTEAQAKAAQEKADQERQERKGRAEKLIPNLQQNQGIERDRFNEVRQELYHPPWYRNPDLNTIFHKLNDLNDRFYPQWDPLVAELKQVLQENGDDPARVGEYLDPSRLAFVRRAAGLDAFDEAVLVACAAPEVLPEYERIYGFLQDDITKRRPTVGLLLRLCGSLAGSPARAREHFHAAAPLVAAGLVTLSDVDGTLPARVARADERVVGHLLGSDLVDERLLGCVHHEAQPRPRALPRTAVELVARTVAGGHPLVALRGRPSIGKAEAARGYAAGLDLGLLVVDVPALLAGAGPDPVDAVRLIFREAMLLCAAVYWSGGEALFDPTHEPVLRAIRRYLASWPVVCLFGGGTDWEPPTTLAGPGAVASTDADADRRRTGRSLGRRAGRARLRRGNRGCRHRGPCRRLQPYRPADRGGGRAGVRGPRIGRRARRRPG